MHHLPHNRSRPNNRHLDHQVIKPLRIIPRQRRHLRPALHLEHPHRIRRLQHLVDLVILRQIRQIHSVPIVLRNQLHAILQHRHHAQPQQVHLDDPQVRAVLLIPLHHSPPRHRRPLQRHHMIQLPLADHHPPRVLPQVPRQILQPHRQLQILRNPRMLHIEPRMLKRVRHRVVLPAPLPLAHQPRQPPQRLRIEPQRLPHLPRRRLAPIRNHIRRHRRAQLAITLVDVLNRLLPLLLRRQIQINVRPLAPALAEETLKQKLHPHRVNRRNLQRIAHRRIRRAPPPLNQNVVLLAELHNVPNNQEVALETELRNQLELMLHLLLRALHQPAIPLRPVPPYNSLLHPLPQKALHRLTRRHRIPRKLISQIAQLKPQPLRHLPRPLHRSRHIAKQPSHLRRIAQIPPPIHLQQPPCMVQICLVSDRHKHIQHLALILRRVLHPIRRNHRQPQRPRNPHRRLISPLLLPQLMPLQLHVHVPAPKRPHQSLDDIASRLFTSANKRRRQRPLISTRQTNKPLRKLLHVRPSRRALALVPLTHLEPRHQLAQILIPHSRLAQHRQPRRLLRTSIRQPRSRPQPLAHSLRSNLRPNMRAHIVPLRTRMEPRRPIHPIPVEQRHRRHADLHCPLHQPLRLRRPL